MAGETQAGGRSRVGALLRTAGGAVGRATGLGRTRGASHEEQEPASTGTGAAQRAPAKKVAAKKTAAKTTAKQPAAKKAGATKTAAKKTAVKKVAAAKQPPAKKAAASRTAAKKTTAAKKAASTSTPAKTTARSTAGSSATPTTKKETVSKSASKSAGLVVKEDESPWTPAELAQVKAELSTDVERLQSELRAIEADIAGLITDSSGGAGDDQADVGSKAFEREYEYSLAQTNRAALEQAEHALGRIEAGTYGVCESCGNAIGKLRLQAFPRATLCMTCKQKQEKRH